MSHSGSASMQKQPTNYSFSEWKRKTMKKEGFLAKFGQIGTNNTNVSGKGLAKCGQRKVAKERLELVACYNFRFLIPG